MLLLFCEIASIHVQTMLKSMACQRTIEGAGGGIKPGINCSPKLKAIYTAFFRILFISIVLLCLTMLYPSITIVPFLYKYVHFNLNKLVNNWTSECLLQDYYSYV